MDNAKVKRKRVGGDGDSLIRAFVAALVTVTTIGCGDGSAPVDSSTGRLYQVGTLQALLDADYTGRWTFAEVEPNGDVGLGTFDGINGELVAADGGYWHVYPDGSVREVDPGERTPFAQVTNFVPERWGEVSSPLDCGSTLDAFVSNQAGYGEETLFVATITGEFSAITTRAIEKQYPPYEPLSALIPGQHRFPMSNVSGTMVLVRSPDSLGTLSQAGYHYHFITSDHERGGHVLSCTVRNATVVYQKMTGIDVTFPPDQ